MYNFNAYKANVLLLLQSSLVIFDNYLQHNIDISMGQILKYMELTNVKSIFPKMRHYVRFLQIGSHL